ncbi:MAG: hypothetical protein ACRCW9_04085 [Cetobacterium sp.]
MKDLIEIIDIIECEYCTNPLDLKVGFENGKQALFVFCSKCEIGTPFYSLKNLMEALKNDN